MIFKQILAFDGWGISCEIALIWVSLDFTDDQSTLVQVMAWYRQATSHYLSQCWPRSLLPYGVTRPQGVNVCSKTIFYAISVVYINSLVPGRCGSDFKSVISELMLQMKSMSTSCALRWIPQNTFTHWGRDKMAVVSQTTFSHTSSKMKIIVV